MKNYGTIIITYVQSPIANKFWSEQIAAKISELLGVTLTAVQKGTSTSDYNISLDGKTVLNIYSSTSNSFNIAAAVSQTSNSGSKSLIHNNLKISIDYIKSGNYCSIKFYGVDNSAFYVLFRKDGNNLEVAYLMTNSTSKYNNNYSEFYNVNDSTKKEITSSFPFIAPSGKIYVCDALIFDTSSGNFVEQTQNVLSCSSVGVDTNVKFNGKNYYAISKNFVMEKTE